MVDFPPSNFMYNTITTNNFFRNVHRLIKAKVHLCHSQTTVKILGYAHDFCNWSVRENEIKTPMIVHNLFAFDMFLFIKRYMCNCMGYKRFKFWWNKFNT